MKTLLLDLGGVVFLGKPTDPLFSQWADQFGLDATRLRNQIWYGPDIEAANIGQISAEIYFEHTAQRIGTEPAHIQTMIETLFFMSVNHKLVAYARQLREKLVPVSALTNNWSFARRMVAHHGLTDLFDHFISSAEVGAKKPHEAIYHIALEQLKVPASDVVFVDDTLENIAVAERLGMRGIHFESTDQAIAHLTQIFATEGK